VGGCDCVAAGVCWDEVECVAVVDHEGLRRLGCGDAVAGTGGRRRNGGSDRCWSWCWSWECHFWFAGHFDAVAATDSEVAAAWS
jgi:hypothetical protein